MDDHDEADDSSDSGLHRRTLLGAVGGAGAATLAGLPGAVAKTGDSNAGGDLVSGSTRGLWGDATAEWAVDAAERIERTDANTAPVMDSIDEVAPNLHIWDSWPLRNRDGSVACVNGWTVLFSLTSADALLPGKRHDVAEIRYFYSKDGRNWELGGPVFIPGRPKGNRQWASSAVYDEETDEVFMFYTATGRESVVDDPYPPSEDLTYEQRLALAEGVTLETSETGVDFNGKWEHSIILTADGEMYQTREQSEGIIYAFRDPWYFRDPDSGEEYLVFEGNTPLDPDESPCDTQDLEGGDYLSGVAAEGAQFNGNVGLAVSTDEDDMSEWELRPPLLDAVCVNQQLERGNVLVMDGRYYLFFDSHKFTFADGIDGPDGLYGFVADSLHGDYRPLNEGGLVVANPEEAPFQAYSWMPVPYGEGRMAVLSYDNYNDLPKDTSLRNLRSLPRSEQQKAFGGTLAPTLIVEVDDDETEIVDTRPPGFLPSECSDPPLPGCGVGVSEEHGRSGDAETSD
jgi:levansucrase